jgi:DNA-binding transcriptional ArsR family regulator
MEQAREIAELLKALANEHRLRILCALIDGPRTVGALGTVVPDIGQSALSQHLALMKAHGIVDGKKTGQNVTYFIADRRIADLVDALKMHCCHGN